MRKASSHGMNDDCIAAIMPGAACFVNSPGYPGQVVGVSLAPLSGVVPVCELAVVAGNL